ncbi:hypothetical protein AQ482_15245, partial [Acinetobacter baumannii]
MTYGEVMNTIQKIELDTAKLLINGQFIESKTQEWQDIVNPATQEVIGRVPFATLEEVDAAIQLHKMLLLLGAKPQFRHVCVSCSSYK